MTCKLTEKRNMTVMALVGLAMVCLGALAGGLLPEEEHALTRIAGAVTGAGTAFALMGGGVLLWRRIIGEQRARDGELAMTDERGQQIAYKAQSALAIAAVMALVIILLVATVRGDALYMTLASGLCLLSAAVKLAAWRFHSRRM